MLLTAGCGLGSDSHGAEAEPELGPIRVIADTDEIVLPIDAYIEDRKQRVLIKRAAWTLVKKCTERFAIEYTLPLDLLLRGTVEDRLKNGRRYGVSDLQSVSKYGYNEPPETRPVVSNDNGSGWNPSETEMLILRGPTGGAASPKDVNGNPLAEGGCEVEADRKLAEAEGNSAPAAPDLSLPGRLSIESFKLAERDSRVQAAMKGWSDCMARSGFKYKSIWDPHDTAWPDGPSSAEIATAKADVECKKQVNLLGIWYATESAYQKQKIDANIEAMNAITKYQQVTSRNAARIVGS
jgi:hypothetical protein